MKKSLFLSLILSAQVSFGMSGKAPPPNDHSGREQCAFYDAGSTEEHAPHRSFGECKASHPNCEERCFTFYQRCTVEGIRHEQVRENNTIITKEVTRTYTGSDRDSYIAISIAERSCRSDYPYNEYCRTKGCTEDYDRTR